MQKIPYFRNSPVAVLLLSIFTCGIYHLYWNYKIAQVINAVCEREIIDPTAALFSGCCFPLNIYFFYVTGNALPEISQRAGHYPPIENKSTLLMVLGLLFPMVAAMILQGHINEIYDRKGQNQ